MKKIFLLLLLMLSVNCSSAEKSIPEMGDIIFQSTTSSQSAAIAEASGSKFTHVGIIIIQNNKPFVYEASNEVKFTPLSSWIANGNNKDYSVKRLKNSKKILSSQVQLEMFKIVDMYLGKKYDILFQWTDNVMYCSELVWKVYYYGAGIELCKVKAFRDYKLEGKEMKNLIAKRYNGIVNMNERVVAPSDIYESEILYSVRY